MTRSLRPLAAALLCATLAACAATPRQTAPTVPLPPPPTPGEPAGISGMQPAQLRVAFGAPAELQDAPTAKLALFGPRKVVAYLAESLKLPANKITLLVAPAASMAGNFQVVARALETTLHKLHELKFDLGQVVSGFGTAPLPPVAVNDLEAIGRTNDAILYGGRVVLWVRADDAVIDRVGPKVPSSSSKDHGAPFAQVFARYNQDFYKIDPMLFSPAEVVFHNLKTGKSHAFGRVAPEVLLQSFFA